MNEWTESDAFAALAILPGVGPRSLENIRKRYRSFAEAVVAQTEQVASVASAASFGAGQAIRETTDLWGNLQAVRRAASAAGALLVTRYDAGWPDRLAELDADDPASEPPTHVFVRGTLATLASRFSVAVVGSRKPDALARAQATALAGDLAEAGVAVVSGGAAGIDTLAHEAALEAGGFTVAVLGTGLDVAYPRQNRRLFDRIAESGGAVVSEAPFGTRASAGIFPKRNRIVSGLADAVLVVGATQTSGTLITAGHGLSQGRVVCAVPGDPRRALSAGTNRLLVRGAAAVLEASDVLEILFDRHGAARDGGLAADWLSERREGAEDGALAVGPQVPLSPRGQRVLGRLEAVPHGADALASALGLSGAEVASALAELEVAGLAERVAGGYVLAATFKMPRLEEGPGKR